MIYSTSEQSIYTDWIALSHVNKMWNSKVAISCGDYCDISTSFNQANLTCEENIK